MESSRRDLSIDMAEHRPILKNNQNMYNRRFGFTLKAGMAFPKTGFCFYCVSKTGDIQFHAYEQVASPERIEAYPPNSVAIKKRIKI